MFIILADIPLDVGLALLKWVYTDQSDIIYSADDSFALTLLTVAKKYKLDPLASRYVYGMFALVRLLHGTSYIYLLFHMFMYDKILTS